MNLPSDSTVIFFSPHPDDESIAAGGLLYELSKRENRILVYYLANSPKGVVGHLPVDEKIKIRQQEAVNACNILGAEALFLNFDSPSVEVTRPNVDVISKIIKEHQPRLVITLSKYERHPTHARTTLIVEQAMHDSSIPLWFGEVWTPLLDPYYIHLYGEEAMEAKYLALKQYTSQLERTSWADAAKALSIYRALTSAETQGNFGVNELLTQKYAEVFSVKQI